MKTLLTLSALSAAAIAGTATPPAVSPAPVQDPSGMQDPCERSAHKMRKATRTDAQADFWEALAAAMQMTDPGDINDAVLEAQTDLMDALDEAEEIYDARLELCALLGGLPYDPDIDPADFSSDIDNSYLPYIEGHTWVYEAVEDGETEIITVSVTDETREIMGIECRIVNDIVTIDGEVVEDTDDYYAQDAQGNVWYMGEVSRNFEDGFLVDLEGSWIAGVEGAKPGIVMHANSVVGETYRQEFLIDEAEDVATVLALDATANVPFGGFMNCRQTRDFTPLEPDANEHKFYAKNVGLVLECKPDEGTRVELISFTTE
ncbi:MAG: hypothetical protein GY711_06670 [bacterium]|nr:hypothetical protein [bacterium]